MGRDREAALVVDLGDRRAHRPERPDRLLDPQREQVAAERRDLLADDRPRRAGRDRAAIAARGERRVDALVVGDRDDVELGRPLDVVEDLDDAGRPVGGEGVDVQVGAPDRRSVIGRRSPALGRSCASADGVALRTSGAASRSGQIGKKTANHCSGAAAMSRSKAARLGCDRRRDPLAPRALGRERDRVEPSRRRGDAVRVAPDAEDVAAGRRSRGRAAPAGGERRRRAEELDGDAAAGDVAVAEEPDRLAAPQRAEQLAARLAQVDDARGPIAPRVPLEVAWRSGSAIVSIGTMDWPPCASRRPAPAARTSRSGGRRR